MESLENFYILSPEKCTHSTYTQNGSLGSSQSCYWLMEFRMRNTAMGPWDVTDKVQREGTKTEKKVRATLLKYTLTIACRTD